MPEAYRCICNNDAWLIFSGFIKCSKCGMEFELGEILFLDVKRFNEFIKMRRKKNKRNVEKELLDVYRGKKN